MKLKFLRRFSSIFLLIIISFSCNSDASSINKQIALYKKYLSETQFNKTWRKEYLDVLFHPGLNYLALPINYLTIDTLPKLKDGVYIFSKILVNSIVKSNEPIIFSDRDYDSHLSEVFIVDVTYKIVKEKIDGIETSYNPEKDIQGYWVFAFDETDGLYKVYDEVPGWKTRFIGERIYSNK